MLEDKLKRATMRLLRALVLTLLCLASIKVSLSQSPGSIRLIERDGSYFIEMPLKYSHLVRKCEATLIAQDSVISTYRIEVQERTSALELCQEVAQTIQADRDGWQQRTIECEAMHNDCREREREVLKTSKRQQRIIAVQRIVIGVISGVCLAILIFS